MSLHLSPTCLPHLSRTLGALGRMSLHLSSTCLPHLSFTLGVLGRMILHLSPTCLPHLSPTLVSHSGCLGPHAFALVSHLFPTCFPLVSHTCLPLWLLGPHEFTLVSYTCLPGLSPTLGVLGRMILHLCPTCSSHLGALGRIDKCKLMRPKQPEWETCVGDKWETSGKQVGDKCKRMRPKAPRVGDKCGRQVWETSGRQV